ncbi:MAG: hypothetical protein J6X55_01790, partial [Victivallales bacterium]|nr:hypothetical protein [Victivallales bacterium]
NRPIAPFLDLLRDHGVLSLTGTAFPLHLQGQLAAGHFAFPGDISSQIVTGLLFALPLLPDDSEIRWTTPLESSGYVDLTIQVLRHFGIHIDSVQGGFDVAGRQKYVSNASIEPEIDWSGAAFWLAMNALGSSIKLPKLNLESAQPDSAIVEILKHIGEDIDISQCPDSFPVLAVVAAATNKVTHFTNVKRLRYKESDRIAAMADMLNTLGVKTTESENDFTVFGQTVPLKGGSIIRTYDDHRIAMAAAVAATVADAPLTIDNSQCVSKSYEGFWKQFEDLDTL